MLWKWHCIDRGSLHLRFRLREVVTQLLKYLAEQFLLLRVSHLAFPESTKQLKVVTSMSVLNRNLIKASRVKFISQLQICILVSFAIVPLILNKMLRPEVILCSQFNIKYFVWEICEYVPDKTTRMINNNKAGIEAVKSMIAANNQPNELII